MSRLLNLYEMPRPRGDATWAVLDWAAGQPGEFTIQDMYKVYLANGGGSTYQQFSTIINKFVAKPWKDDQEKYALSDKRPLVVSKRGSRGKGGAGSYTWGLTGPLREPPAAGTNVDADDDAVGQAIDRLEELMGADQLKAALARWKRLGDLHKVAADIRASVPARGQMDAMHVASDSLIDAGRATPQDAEDAEDEVAPAPPEQGGQQAKTPFSPPTVKPQAAPAAKAAPKPEPDDDDSEESDSGVPAGGWDADGNPVHSQDDEEHDVPDDFFHDAGGGTHRANEPDREYPAYLPDPDEGGDKYESAMFRLVDEGNIDEHDPIWEKLKAAKNDVDAQRIIRSSKIPQNLQRSALLVARAIFDNTGRDWETGEKVKESRLMRLYGEGPLAEPVDFDQQSGLQRILKIRGE